MNTPTIRARGRLGRAAASAVLSLSFLAPASAQTATAEAGVLQKAEAALGDSPVAAILEAAGPDAREFNDHVVTLANPFMEGRVPGVPGNRLAAEYIEFYLKRAGLEPAFKPASGAAGGAGFRQPFKAGSTVRVTEQSVRFSHPDGPVTLTAGKDFSVLGVSGSGTARGTPVFVGYSIEDGEDGYETYPEGTDLSGKVAIMLRYEPLTAGGTSRWSEKGWSPASSLDAKLRAAARRGAAAVILVNPPGVNDPRARDLADTESTRGRPLDIPVVMLTPQRAVQLIRAADPTDANRSLRDFRAAADREGGIVHLPNATVTIRTAVEEGAISSDNVGGLLPGRGDLKDQYLVIGAHYDHIGYGPGGVMEESNQGKLHPGADDNASGTAAMLVLAGRLARAYAELPEGTDARSIVFVAFSAEESGLIGSRHFVKNPCVKLDSIKLMINLDMVGRLRAQPPLDVEGAQSGEGLLEWVRPYFERAGIEASFGANVSGSSDHHSFYREKIPVLFFFTGYHEDYHRPGDVASRINQLGAARVIALTHEIALGAAQRPEAFAFAPPRPRGERAAAPAAPAQPDDDEAEQGAVRGSRVRFGAMPAYSDDGPGILLDGVSEGTSAEAAGVIAGDRLMKWNGRKIEDIHGWMAMLGEHKPGDVVEVTVLRDGKEVVLKAKLGASERGGR